MFPMAQWCHGSTMILCYEAMGLWGQWGLPSYKTMELQGYMATTLQCQSAMVLWCYGAISAMVSMGLWGYILVVIP